MRFLNKNKKTEYFIQKIEIMYYRGQNTLVVNVT
jgi:hypothetical protein